MADDIAPPKSWKLRSLSAAANTVPVELPGGRAVIGRDCTQVNKASGSSPGGGGGTHAPPGPRKSFSPGARPPGRLPLGISSLKVSRQHAELTQQAGSGDLLIKSKSAAGRNRYGVHGVHLSPLGFLVLRASIPGIWSILSAFLPS
jgi:hypothetical protein